MRDDISMKVVGWNVLHLLLTIAGTQVDIISVTLTPKTDPISVIENVPQRFRCVTSLCRPAASILWFLGSTPLTAGTESNTSNDVTTSTLEYIPQKNHQNMQIFCRGENGGQLRTSDQPRLNVLYAPSEPVCKLGGLALSSAVAVREFGEFRLDCSSDGNPSPSYSWTHPGDGPSTPLVMSSIHRTHDGIFRIIASSHLIPSNQQAVNLTKKTNVNVDVQYPPDPPSCKVRRTTILSNIVSAIRGHTITISCSCDSNPPSRYSWSVTGVSASTSGQRLHLLVQNATTITFTMENSMMFTNGSTEQGRRNSSFDVNVLYPPDPPSCKFGRTAISSNIVSAIRGHTISINCSCDSNPPSRYSWSVTGVSTPTSGQSLHLLVQNATTITFTMENSMMYTNGSTEQGRRHSSFDVNVLFPPVVKPLTNVMVLERGSVSVACHVTAGVPNKTEFKWVRMSDMTPISMEQTLNIANIDRKQAGNYTCIASNLMRPTGCDATVGNSSNTINIDVQYEAEVTDFTLSNFNHWQNLEVDENTQVTFYCKAQGNPLSNISMFKEHQDIRTTSNTSDLEFTISKSVCEDEGTYQCTAQNTHNTQADIRSLTLFVRCAPRASTLAPRHQNITSAIGEPAVLTLRLVAFPRPRVADFTWENDVSAHDTWVIVRNDANIDILISEDGLQTQLSFSSVKQDDFGYYRVHVNNELGNYTETFRLQAQVMTEFTISGNGTGTDGASVRQGENLKLICSSSRNDIGFVDWYKTRRGYSDNSTPPSVSIKMDSGGTCRFNQIYPVPANMHCGCVSISQYMCTLISVEADMRGEMWWCRFAYGTELSSTFSSTNKLTIDVTGEQAESQGAVIGGSIGGGITAVLLIIGVVFIVKRFRTSGQGNNRSGTDVTGCNAAQTYDELSMRTETSVYDALRNGDNGPENSPVYSQLDESKSSQSDVYYKNVQKENPVYSNTML
ncbi:hemicentin-2-like isoform X2 [Mya arenaria]|uniref:hemicentin-2-like isoform X2 n=1 Tax=Mya arenaria TaxID=6604 RepID=UPI0022E0B9D9|nr:hemicentin-2-like isoform X2 [Mya arenaria]